MNPTDIEANEQNCTKEMNLLQSKRCNCYGFVINSRGTTAS